MIYRVFKGYDTGEEPIWEWHCDCEKCLTTVAQCSEVKQANFNEIYRGVKRIINLFGKKKPQDTALYASLRR